MVMITWWATKYDKSSKTMIKQTDHKNMQIRWILLLLLVALTLWGWWLKWFNKLFVLSTSPNNIYNTPNMSQI